MSHLVSLDLSCKRNLFEFPQELLLSFLDYLPFSALGRLALTSKAGKFLAEEIFFSRAREFSARPADVKEAREFLAALCLDFEGVYELGVLPQKYLIPAPATFDTYLTLRNLRTLTAADVFSCYQAFRTNALFQDSIRNGLALIQYFSMLLKTQVIGCAVSHQMNERFVVNWGILVDSSHRALNFKNCSKPTATKEEKKVFFRHTDLLLSLGVDLNYHQPTQPGVLYYAAMDGHQAAVRFLLDRGATAVVNGYSSLNIAAQNGHIKVVRLLLDSGQFSLTEGELSLLLAARWERRAVLGLLLERGVDPLRARDAHGNTPLHLAAAMGNIHCVKRLAKIMNLNVQNNLGQTPLHLPRVAGVEDWVYVMHYRQGRLEVVRFLLSQGANPHLQDFQERTPRQFCEEIDDHEVANLL